MSSLSGNPLVEAMANVAVAAAMISNAIVELEAPSENTHIYRTMTENLQDPIKAAKALALKVFVIETFATAAFAMEVLAMDVLAVETLAMEAAMEALALGVAMEYFATIAAMDVAAQPA